ncbi:histidine kinase [Streptomyces sp. NPDC002812]|uniref:sensor histidine kinase n=1 Tax=unclassified Streptomyces TaxID=2593676 RepID=UPI00202EC841|nr:MULTISPECIES: histidine kinase [unclassified Streptomyces]MCM1971876.1 histidine kinase [Streptomyces sp. G1]MCX5130313.1 histidine kinase [Streptomyces sp. NBC_00347]MCX5301694.1 histidine kinase [Streptomyces sp. NBC_00193]
MTGRFRTADNDLAQGTEQAETKNPDKRGRVTDVLAPRLAQGIVVTVLSGYAIVTLLNVEYALRDQRRELFVCATAVMLLYGLQLVLTSPKARRWSTGRKCAALGVQLFLTFLPLVWLNVLWGSVAGPLSASVLLLAPPRIAWPSFAAISGVVLWWAVGQGGNVLDLAYSGISTALTGLVVYGLTRLTDLVNEVHETRAEMARMAVIQERLRFARDLHDLLGYSLSAISLKCELIQRVVVNNPERAREEVVSVLGVSRQALVDVRAVARGYRDMSLAAEAVSVVDVMASAGVEAEVDIDCGRLHPLVDTVLATALREGVTNILRHSKVQSCTIRAAVDGETVELVMENDGVVAVGLADPADRGSGLGNLDTRLTAIGGTLTAGIEPQGRFRVTARAPMRPVAPDPPDSVGPRGQGYDGSAGRASVAALERRAG